MTSNPSPTPRQLKLLLVEDSADDAELLLGAIESVDWVVNSTRVFTEADYLRELEGRPDLILADFRMPQFSGLRALELLQERGGDIPFIIVSGAIGEETAVEAMRKGAKDYLLKDRLARLNSAIFQALENARLERERQTAVTAVMTAEEKYRSLFENSVLGIYQTTEDGQLLIANPALARISGHATPAELMANVANLAEQIYSDPREYERFRHAMRTTGSVRRFETQMRRVDGSLVWISASAWRICDAAGHVRFEGTLEDITERRNAEQEIQAQLTELRRWHDLTLGREQRILALKTEVNELLARAGQPWRYQGADA